MDSKTSPLNCLPPELLQQILQSLPIVELMRCRVVCRSWRALVDSFSDECWRRLCSRDHAEVCERARTKSSPDLTWRQLYKSLHLWTKLDSVDEYNWIEVIRHRKRRLLHYGVCGINTFNGQILLQENDTILYFDSDGEQVGVFDTELQQIKYDETDNLIVYIGNNENSVHRRVNKNSELRIIKKVDRELDLEGKIVIPDVENFIIVGNDVYYNTYYDNKSKETTIYQCRAKENYTSTKLKTFSQEIVTYGCNNDKVNVLVGSSDIYMLENGNFVQIENRLSSSNSLAMARKYNLKPNEDFLLSISCDISLVIHSYCFYGKLTFLGCNDATVKVYDTEKFLEKPYLLFDEPLEEFDLYEWLQPVHKVWRNITGVDVMEKKNGHIIVASIPKGAYAIELTHEVTEYQELVNKTVDSEKDSTKDEVERKKKKHK